MIQIEFAYLVCLHFVKPINSSKSDSLDMELAKDNPEIEGLLTTLGKLVRIIHQKKCDAFLGIPQFPSDCWHVVTNGC